MPGGPDRRTRPRADPAPRHGPGRLPVSACRSRLAVVARSLAHRSLARVTVGTPLTDLSVRLMVKAIHEAGDRAERSKLRALHRLIQDDDGEDYPSS